MNNLEEQLDSAMSGEEFISELMSLRPEITRVAQEIYDEWELDDEWGRGGICDEIADAIAGVVASNIEDIEIEEGGHEGDDHAYIIADKDGEKYIIDLPHHLYEAGGGYAWKKIQNVKFQEDDVVIEPAY